MRSLKAFGLILGAILFLLMIRRFGVSELYHSLLNQGWRFLLVLIPTALSFVFFSVAWWLLLDSEARLQVSFFELFLISTAGLSLNYALPFVTLAGEPLKAFLLARRLGRQRSVTTVLAYNGLHLLSHLFVYLAATLLSFRLLSSEPARNGILGLVALVMLGLIALLFVFHKNGFLVRLVRMTAHIPFMRWSPERTATWREKAHRYDEGMTEVFRTSKGWFLLALLLDLSGRLILTSELTVMMHNIGQHMDLLRAFVTHSLSGMMMLLTFWIPYEIGVKEGGLAMCLQWLGMDPSHGVYLGVASRLREMIWIAVAPLLLAALGTNMTSMKSGLFERLRKVTPLRRPRENAPPSWPKGESDPPGP